MTEEIELDPDKQRAEEIAEIARLDAEEDGQIFRVSDEISTTEGARLIITRVLPEDKKGYCGEMVSHAFTLERVRALYGPGRYRVRIMGPKGFLPGGGSIVIAEPAPDSPQTMAQVLEKLDQRNRDRVAQQQPSAVNTLEWLKVLAPFLGPMIPALITAMRGPDIGTLIAAVKGPTMPEMMQGLASLKALAPEQTTDPIDRALKLLDVIQEKIPSGGGETNWLDVVREAIKSVGPTLGGAIEGAIIKANTPSLPAPNAGRPPALAAPPGSPAPSVATTGAQPFSQSSGTPNMTALLQWLASQIEFLIVKAARGSDPALYAEVLLDSVPDGLSAETVAQLVARPDWFKYLCQLDSRAQQYEAWFGRLRASILAELEIPADVPDAVLAPKVEATSVPLQGAEIQRPSGKPPSLSE